MFNASYTCAARAGYAFLRALVAQAIRGLSCNLPNQPYMELKGRSFVSVSVDALSAATC